MGPLLPDPGPRGPRLKRRARGIAVELAAFVALTVLSPLLLAAAAVADLGRLVLRRRGGFVGVRLVAFAWCFLFGELRGIAGLFLLNARCGMRDSKRRRDGVYRLRQQWAGGHFDAVIRLFGLRLEVEGLDDVAPGPVIILMRHASIIDNALPDAIVGRAHGMGLRFVLKRELQMLPTIDIGGRWVPTNFVRRGTGDAERELVDLRKLAIDLPADEGVLIYPEGTRYTAPKLARAQEVIRERQPHIAPMADRLTSILPPRLGGPLALLEQGRGTDVVVCAHVGFDGYEKVSDIWNGSLVGSTIQVRFWRHPAATVPAGREELTRWLYDRWQEVDEWVLTRRPRGPEAA